MKTVADIATPDRAPAAPTPLRLLDQVRARIRVLHYPIRTGQAYLHWIKRYIRYFDKTLLLAPSSGCHDRVAMQAHTPCRRACFEPAGDPRQHV